MPVASRRSGRPSEGDKVVGVSLHPAEPAQVAQ